MDDTAKINAQKIELIDRFLEDDHILIHVDPSLPGVDLPEHLQAEAAVTLKLSRLFRGALDLSTDQITTDLLFAGAYYTCVIPYPAVWGCTSAAGKNVIWPEHTPQAVLRQVEESFQKEPLDKVESTEPAPIVPSKRAKQGHLRRIK